MIIIANIFTAIGELFMAYSTFSKSKKNMLIVQVCDCIFNLIGCLFIGAYSAAVVNIIAGTRNLLNAKNKNNIYINGLLVAVLVWLGLILNKNGLIGLLPVLASLIYTICSYMLKSAQGLRYIICFNMIMWFVHDFSIGLYSSACFDVLILVVSFINIIRFNKDSK